MLYQNVVASIDILSLKPRDKEEKRKKDTRKLKGLSCPDCLFLLSIKKRTRRGFVARTCLTSVRVVNTNPFKSAERMPRGPYLQVTG